MTDFAIHGIRNDFDGFRLIYFIFFDKISTERNKFDGIYGLNDFFDIFFIFQYFFHKNNRNVESFCLYWTLFLTIFNFRTSFLSIVCIHDYMRI
jgi:hypothetical protein